MTKKNRVQRARDLLAAALRWSRRHGRDARAKRIKTAQDDLRPATHVTYPGVAAARQQSEHGPQADEGMCLMMVRSCYGIGPKAGDAIGAWRDAKKHRTSDPNAIPRGYPIFWSGGSKGHGHVAISAGDGFCWSTDIRRPGFFDRVPITEIHDRWGLTLLGWTANLNGQPVPAEKTEPGK